MSQKITPRDALLILNAIPGIGNRRVVELIEYYGSAQKVFEQERSQLEQHTSLTQKAIQNIINFPKEAFLAKEFELLKKHNAAVLTYQDLDYPQSLLNISDAPVVLYYKGDIQRIDELSIGIVGSRKASLYGQSMAQKFARELSDYGFTIISGLAAGIDAAAHQGALMAQGTTVGVLGCGLSHVYPADNQKLYEKIPHTGVILSEFPMAMPPLPYNFPRRNRIISGLSLGIVVVEANIKSGALITADFALEHGKEIFAVPGRIDSKLAQGPNQLIKDGAVLAMNTEDVIVELSGELKDYLAQKAVCSGASQNSKQLSDLTELEKFVYDNIQAEPVHIDEIIEKCTTAKTVLLQLELKNLVTQLPGKFFVRKEYHA